MATLEITANYFSTRSKSTPQPGNEPSYSKQLSLDAALTDSEMPALETPPSLYLICLDRLVPWLTKVGSLLDWEDETATSRPLESLGALVEDLLLRAYNHATGGRILPQGAGCWNDDWRVFLTTKLRRAVLPWDKNLLKSLGISCQRLCRVLVSRWKGFTPEDIEWLPNTVLTLDFDGELFYRRRTSPDLEFSSNRPIRGWLPEAEAILKALHVSRQKVLVQQPLSRSLSDHSAQLAELHLGTVQVTHAQLRALLLRCPNLRLLRHYQLVTALYLLHAAEWRRGDRLPVYKLVNLDVDFSHVVRCRMSPEPVLAPDALQLATLLCPDAGYVRVRYDCETPHDVLAALTALRRLRELSVVCVSSGQRSLLDFTDLEPILKQHGHGLASLELKVIEEVDVHVILTSCPRLERLVLSGCGNVTPPTCRSNKCAELKLRKLRLLFFADGDDFSWDHNVPQCFWKAALGRHASKYSCRNVPQCFWKAALGRHASKYSCRNVPQCFWKAALGRHASKYSCRNVPQCFWKAALGRHASKYSCHNVPQCFWKAALGRHASKYSCRNVFITDYRTLADPTIECVSHIQSRMHLPF